jgi:diadenosine tetraphosphatase ApaH/serine/threonine PP2A family protein phosphatase
MPVDGLGDVLFCHATPRNDKELFSVLTPDARLQEIFVGIEQTIVVSGRTHMQFDRPFGGMRLLNAGSEGIPYGEPGAYWALLGPDVELRHTAYDQESAAARIRKSGYPEAEDFAAHNVLRPPTEAEALAFFER